MSNRYNPAELKLRDDAEKVIKNAKDARTSSNLCLGQLRILEKHFHNALDLDRTAPKQIGIMTQFGDRALKLDVTYDKLIRLNQDSIRSANESLDTNFKLMVAHSIVALGKLCQVILAVLPAASEANKVIKGIQTATSASKDLLEASRMPAAGGSAAGKTLEGLLKLLGEQGGKLADLIGGVVDVEGGVDKSTEKESAKRAGRAANIIKLIKGSADTLKLVIECLKHQTALSTRLGGAATILDIFENLLECYANAMKAYEDYEKQIRLARSIGHMNYHARTLRGSNGSASYASRKAFEHAVYKTSAGKTKLKFDLVDFSRAINSETEARNWGMQLRAKTAELKADLEMAQKTLKIYADRYAAEMAKLAVKYKVMLPYQGKLLKAWKDAADYESKHYTGGRRCDTLSHTYGYLRSELKHYDEILAMAQARLAIPAEMSESRLRAT